jgi:CubicO group peptidase (beta-lactamase class C family)
VGDYFNDFGSGADALATMVERVADLPQLTPLGEIWSYNNSGFYLAGRVIEVVTGKSFEPALRDLVLTPLGLDHSYFFAEEVITRRFAVGHNIEEDEARVARPWAIGRAAHPAGGLVCTAGDLLRYARFHSGDGTAADGTRLLTPESLALMQTPQFASSGLSYVGITWFITAVDGTQFIEHGGGTNGQISLLRIVPDRDFALVVLTNAGRGGEIAATVARSALKSYLDLVLPDATPLETPAEALEAYTGRYVSAMRDLSLSVQEGTLKLEITPKGGFPTPDSPPGPTPPPVRMALYAEDRAVGLDAPMKDSRAEFLRNPEGEVAWLRVGGRVHAREARTE